MTKTHSQRLPGLLRGDSERLQLWIRAAGWQHTVWCVLVIAAGAGAYGASIGAWRSPLQALFAAIKLPLILLLTTAGNSILNASLAPLLGAAISPRQTVLSLLSSFALASAILGSFAPLVLFQVWSLPDAVTVDDLSRGSFSSGPSTVEASILLLTNFGVIAFAGIAANLRLLQLLYALSPSPGVARRVLLGWLAGNFLLGTQLTWIFRPFFGSPTLAVEFLRAQPLRGGFFEALWNNFMLASH